jgi:hypothetical protein
MFGSAMMKTCRLLKKIQQPRYEKFAKCFLKNGLASIALIFFTARRPKSSILAQKGH